MENRGYRAVLTDGESGVAVSVKYRKIDELRNQLLDIRAKDLDGSLVQYVSLDAKDLSPVKIVKRYLNEKGVIVPSEAVKYYLVSENGTETEVQKYTKTKEFSVKGYLNKNDLPLFVPESFYELWFDDDKKAIGSLVKLWSWAKKLGEEGKMGVIDFSHGNGFKAYTGLIYPVIEDGKWNLVMCLTGSHFIYKNQMAIPETLIDTDYKKLPTINQLTKMDLAFEKLK